MPFRRTVLVAPLLLLPLLAVPVSAQTAPDPCANRDAIAVPGAVRQVVSCETDLSAARLSTKGLSDASDWAALYSKASRNPPAGAGLQVDGHFEDDSTINTYRQWNTDSQFVIRLPAQWNGQLVVTGAPANRRQYSMDNLVSDWALAQGYAFASTDKGNSGLSFYNNGSRSKPGEPVLEWHERVSELTVAAKEVARQRYGTAPERTWMTGISNSGYLTRWQMEKRPDLFDGAVDWEGTLFTAEGPNLFTYLPTALRDYPLALTDKAAEDRMTAVGFNPRSKVVWQDHYAIYWDLTQRIYREAFDPEYDGTTRAGTPFCRTGGAPGTTSACDAQYDYASRPQEVKDAVASVSLTGKIGKPMITLHGDLDALLPQAADSDVYAEMIDKAGKGKLHRYYVVEDGNHVDDRHDLYPTEVRPILPCYREAFLRLTEWVEDGTAPPVEAGAPAPADLFVERPASGDVANTCPELAAAAAAAPGDRPKGPPPGRPEAPASAGTTTLAAAPVTAAGQLPATGPAALVPLTALGLVATALGLRRRTR